MITKARAQKVLIEEWKLKAMIGNDIVDAGIDPPITIENKFRALKSYSFDSANTTTATIQKIIANHNSK